MPDPVKSIYEALAADSGITGSLSTFNGAPAIISGEQVPAAVDRPYIWIRDPLSDVGREAKDIRGREVLIDVTVAADEVSGTAALMALAVAVRDALHRQALPIEGGSVWMAEAAGPRTMESGEGVAARLVEVRMAYYSD